MKQTKTLLQINSSGRYQGSLTRDVSQAVIEQLTTQGIIEQVHHRDLATGLPFVDEQWIQANFTDPDQRLDTQKERLAFSDSLVNEVQQADVLVIASPIYNFSIPAVLKAWIDMVARARMTFRYTENGPVGLLKDKKAILVMASGGVPIGSEMDLASKYLKQVLGFLGITDVTLIDANHYDQNTVLDLISTTVE